LGNDDLAGGCRSLIDLEGLKQLPDAGVSSQFVSYVVADRQGKVPSDALRDVLRQLCDNTLHLAEFEPVLATLGQRERPEPSADVDAPSALDEHMRGSREPSKGANDLERALRDLEGAGQRLLALIPGSTDDSTIGLAQEVTAWRKRIYSLLEAYPHAVDAVRGAWRRPVQPPLGFVTDAELREEVQACLVALAGVTENFQHVEGAASAFEREARRQRLIRVGELIEQLAPLCHEQGRHPLDQHNEEWVRGTALLRQALAGVTRDELPMSWQLAQEVSRRVDEKSAVGMARREVNDALALLFSENV
jgi:hypothetical protein